MDVLFSVAETKEHDEKVEAYKQCLQQLPPVNHATLKQLVLHLSRSEPFSYSLMLSAGVINNNNNNNNNKPTISNVPYHRTLQGRELSMY